MASWLPYHHLSADGEDGPAAERQRWTLAKRTHSLGRQPALPDWITNHQSSLQQGCVDHHTIFEHMPASTWTTQQHSLSESETRSQIGSRQTAHCLLCSRDAKALVEARWGKEGLRSSARAVKSIPGKLDGVKRRYCCKR